MIVPWRETTPSIFISREISFGILPMSKNTWFPWPSAVCRCRLFDSFKLKVTSYHGVFFLFGKVKLTFTSFFNWG